VQQGAAAPDLRETDLEHKQFLGFGFAGFDGLHAPAQVDRLQVMEPFPEPLPEFGKDMRVQGIPLRLHVAESGCDEDGSRLPHGVLGHGILRKSNVNMVSRSYHESRIPGLICMNSIRKYVIAEMQKAWAGAY